MSRSGFWQRSQVSYNPTDIANMLRSFRREDLADPHSAWRWVQFAKQFSQMDLTPRDVEEMGFETFYALKQILAATLTNLSEETVTQSEKIASLEKEERVLKRDLQSLNRIEKQNLQKQQKLRQDFRKLQDMEREQDLRVNQESFVSEDMP